jgi:trimeric autotransporter adhesin
VRLSHLSFLLVAAISPAQEYKISTFAGAASPAAKGLDLSIGSPQGIALDSAGNAYFTALNCVFKQDVNGVVTHIAGTTRAGYSGDGGPAATAELNLDGLGFGGTGGGVSPTGMAVDRADNIYVADFGNYRVRRITPDGIITTVAGTGAQGFSGDGGPAVSAQLRQPSGVAVDAKGNLFVADLRVRRVSPDGIITTVAGNGDFAICSTCGDGGQATNAGVIAAGIAVDGAGNLYIADTASYRIRKVSPNGIISTVAGRGRPNFSCTPSGDGGRAIDAQLCDPAGVAVDAAGNLFFADTVGDFDGDFRQIVRKVSPGGTITTVAGVNCFDFCPAFEGDGGLATKAFLTGALGLAVDAGGGLLITDPLQYRIRRVSADGIITTVAGGGEPRFDGDGGPAIRANLLYPTGVAADRAGNVFIADTLANRIYKVSHGIIATIGGGGSIGFTDSGPAIRAELQEPYGLAVDAAGSAFFIEGGSRVRKISPEGLMSTVAGYGGVGDAGDGGPAILAAFRGPSGVAADRAGNVFIVDSGNGEIRRVAPDGAITAVAVTPLVGPLAADEAGNLYVGSQARVWRLSPDGVVTPVAGTGEPGFSGDGGRAIQAQLSKPTAIAVDAAGSIYIADDTGGSLGTRIRKISPDGVIRTIAGNDAPLSWVAAIAVDGAGRVYVTDSAAGVVRVLQPATRLGDARKR